MQVCPAVVVAVAVVPEPPVVMPGCGAKTLIWVPVPPSVQKSLMISPTGGATKLKTDDHNCLAGGDGEVLVAPEATSVMR